MQQERLKALGEMASGIAHDINNAISPAALYVESLLEQEAGLSDRVRDYLSTIQRAIEDVAQTVSRMREFYRQRETQLVLAPIDLNRMVQQVIDLPRVPAGVTSRKKRGVVIRVQSELASGLPNVMGAEGEIRDALTNLVFNAVDAMADGGTLTLRTRVVSVQQHGSNGDEPASVVHVEVCDTGIGMDEETKRRSLEPFFTTKGERGTGLGLAMVYGMTQRHSAGIEIESKLGTGTTMRLLFPVPTAVTPRPSDPPSLRHWYSNCTFSSWMMTRCYSNRCGTSWKTTVTVSIRLRVEKQGSMPSRKQSNAGESCAAVITDLGMPYVDGRAVAAAIKEISPSTPVILLTGWGQRLLAEHDIPPHVDRLLSKPPKLHDLRMALAELTTGRMQRLMEL